MHLLAPKSNHSAKKTFSFACGCKFDVIDNDNGEFPLVFFDTDTDNISFECQKTWSLISEGNTKGCFQLESRLGQTMARKLKPENIEQLAGLISILRPGCLDAIRDGKSVSNHYIDKKNGSESIDYYHDSLIEILSKTYGEMIYQEQAMGIAKKIAGFDLQEADLLRKAIGKKKPEEMAKIRSKFLDGAATKSFVTSDQAKEIFGWIEKSQRYSFNKSHAVSYAINAYLSAFAKAHFPRIFFASYLRYAKDKVDPQQEIKELVRNAIEMDIDICGPDLRHLNDLFILKQGKIYFGLTDIKGVGQSVYKKILSIISASNHRIEQMSWTQMLLILLVNININAAKALISSGALDYMKKTRTSMLFELEIISQLTKKESENILSLINDTNKDKHLKFILQLLAESIDFRITSKRKDVLHNLLYSLSKPPYSLDDKIEWLSDSENFLLGTSITCSKIDSYDVSMANTDCKTFKRTVMTKNIIIAGEIANINFTKTKTGKNPGQEMAFITIEDNTGSLDSVIMFPEQLSQYRAHLYVGNVLIFLGTKSKSKDGFIVEKCFTPMS
jgi:DNA polymerase III subunit alpha